MALEPRSMTRRAADGGAKFTDCNWVGQGRCRTRPRLTIRTRRRRPTGSGQKRGGHCFREQYRMIVRGRVARPPGKRRYPRAPRKAHRSNSDERCLMVGVLLRRGLVCTVRMRRAGAVQESLSSSVMATFGAASTVVMSWAVKARSGFTGHPTSRPVEVGQRIELVARLAWFGSVNRWSSSVWSRSQIGASSPTERSLGIGCRSRRRSSSRAMAAVGSRSRCGR